MKKSNIFRLIGIALIVAAMVFTMACKKDAGRQQPSASSAAQQTVAASEAAAPAPVSVTGVTISKATLSLNEKATETITATAAPADAENKAVTWSSSNTGVATVDAAGKITAVKAGKATITVITTDGGKTAACEVTVTAAAAPAGVIPAGIYVSLPSKFSDARGFEFSGNTYRTGLDSGSGLVWEGISGTYTAKNGILYLNYRLTPESEEYTREIPYTLSGNRLTTTDEGMETVHTKR